MPPAGAAPAEPERFVDLHMHSTASDGALPPGEVVAAAKRAGLVAIALTDHDTVAGLAEAREVGDRLGVRVVAGVELSAVEEDEVHLLGLHLARLDEVERQLAAFREARRERARQIVDRLNALGLPVTLDAVMAQAGTGAVGRPHIARALIAGGWARDLREAFERWLGNGRPAYVEKRRLALADAIRLVHDAGGIAVLAHPGSEARRARLEALRAIGLDGVEVRHPSHTPEDVARIAALAEHLQLVPSGGSDWHGNADGPRVLGAMHIPESWLQQQDERVRARAAAEIPA
ncbi:MAG: PHP domain-containing protein [Gemmatimonadaceae bacterium]|nr:PHP domain-containing protein [Gemmatimonadaceae bacterium]